MSTVQQILVRKGSHVLSVGPKASVLDAVAVMNEHRIGALVVIDRGRVVGLFTERDLMCRVVGPRRDPGAVAVEEVMTREVICCKPDTSLDEARSIFKHRRIRHLPVVSDGGELRGLVSIGDLNAWQIDGQAAAIRHLQSYLYERV